MSIIIRELDFGVTADADVLRRLLDEYARDPMGGRQPLPADVLRKLPASLASVNGAFSVAAFMSEEPVGLINCLPSFSTFKCQPIVNIHDIIVSERARGQQVCGKMLALVQDVASARGCCKITLEVLEGNKPAQQAYARFGFQGYELDPAMGRALFWELPLPG